MAERREILDALRTRLSLPDDIGLLEGDADALDAVVCLLAAKDFVEKQAVRHDALTPSRRAGSGRVGGAVKG